MFNMQVVCHVFFKKKQKITSSSTESRISFLKKVSYTPGLPHKPFSFVDRKKKNKWVAEPVMLATELLDIFYPVTIASELGFLWQKPPK